MDRSAARRVSRRGARRFRFGTSSKEVASGQQPDVGRPFQGRLEEIDMTIHRRALVVLMLALCTNLSPQAQGKRRLTLIDLLNVPRLTEPQLSPDGRQVIYQLAEADWKANKRV